MPPLGGPFQHIDKLVKDNDVVIFATTTCPFCKLAKQLFEYHGINYKSLDIDTMGSESVNFRASLIEYTTRKTVPQIYVKTQHLGGYTDLKTSIENGTLSSLLEKEMKPFDYDLVVIGGGSGGLSASKAAANLGKRVAVLDFVHPTPTGTTWGLGGTCVNVGCIPKKLMHTAALIGTTVNDAPAYGWKIPEKPTHSWDTLKDNVVNYIRSLNWNYKVALKDAKVQYLNSSGKFISPHTIQATTKQGKTSEISAETFIVATGERPRYLDLPGAKECCITSDDLFSLGHSPGKTLVIGASYVALECAGFLRGIGLDVTLMVRSIFLRGFDQEMADKVGAFLEQEGIKILRPCQPHRFERIEEGNPGKIKVWGKIDDKDEISFDIYNTVLLAIGRDACTTDIGLETVGVDVDKSGRVIVNDGEQTSVPYIYAIGDIINTGLQLTPVAIQAGKLLVDRLYNGQNIKCDYLNVPTTVFTPLEYGAIGYAEEKAIEVFGEEDIEVYHSTMQPLEWNLPYRDNNICFVKLICVKSQNEKVVGFHYLGPNAGEVTQGFGLAMKFGPTKADFDSAIGIHPTCAEIFTTLSITKRSGASAAQKGC